MKAFDLTAEVPNNVIGGYDYKFEIEDYSGSLRYSIRFELLQITYLIDGKKVELTVPLKKDHYLELCKRISGETSLEELKLELMIMGSLTEQCELPPVDFIES